MRTYTTADMCLGAVPAMRGSENWRQVARIISDVSETVYCAGWLIHCEYDVYRLMTEGGRWGWHTADELPEYLGALKSLSERYGVWASWCHDHGPEPVELEQWKSVYKQWRAERRPELACGPERHTYDDGENASEGDLCVWCLAPKPPTGSQPPSSENPLAEDAEA